MMSKNDEKLEKIATQITVAVMSNPEFTAKAALSAKLQDMSDEDIEDAIIDMGFRVAKKIIKRSEKESNEKSKS